MKLFAILLAVIASMPLVTLGRDRVDFFINETVFLRPGAEARVDDKPVDISTVPFPPTVEKRDGDWLWLEKAWVRKKHVMNAREAVEYYTEQTQKTPNDAALWRILGVAWQHAHSENQNEFALKSFTEALRLDPNDASTYRFRAEVFRQQQKHDEAIKDFNEAIRLNPKDPEIYADRGTSRIWHREVEEGINDFTAAIELDPDNAEYYQQRGSWRKHFGDLDGCLKDYQEIIRLCESGKADKKRYGFAYGVPAKIKATWPEEKYRDGKQAFELATTAYEISSSDTKPRGFEEPDVIERVANAAAEAGDFDAAVKWAKLALKWLQKSPNNDEGDPRWEESKSDLIARIEQFKNQKPYRDPEECNDIAWAKATCRSEKYRDGKRALELATKACELTDWKYSNYLETFAAACAETGDFAKAVEWQQKALELDTFDRGHFRTVDAKENAKERLEQYQKNQPVRE